MKLYLFLQPVIIYFFIYSNFIKIKQNNIIELFIERFISRLCLKFFWIFDFLRNFRSKHLKLLILGTLALLLALYTHFDCGTENFYSFYLHKKFHIGHFYSIFEFNEPFKIQLHVGSNKIYKKMILIKKLFHSEYE